jgi:dienelactone hydrolase
MSARFTISPRIAGLALPLGAVLLLAAPTITAESPASELIPKFKRLVIDQNPPRQPWYKMVGDVTGDGNPEIIVAGRAGPIVMYSRPDWKKRVIAETGSEGGVRGSLADINGNGRLDMVMGGIVWLENPGPSGGDWKAHRIDRQRVHDVLVADLNGNGRLEVVARDQSAFGNTGNTVYIYHQESPNSWRREVLDAPHGEGIALADVDGDGRPDIVLGGVWFRNDSGAWRAHRFAAEWTHPHVKVEVGDINGNGRLDIVLTPAELKGQRYRISWFESPPGEKSRDWTEHVIVPEVEAVVHSLALGDFNKNGALDLAYAEMHQGDPPQEVVVMFNLDQGAKWEKLVIDTAGSHDIVAADLDGDGDLDIVGANHDGGHPVVIWENQLVSRPSALRGTLPLDWPEVQQAEMADRLMDGAHRFVDRKIEEAMARRERHWNRDISGETAAYESSIASNRKEFARLIGVVDERAPVRMERFGDDLNPALVAEHSVFWVYQVRWPVLDVTAGVSGEGLLVEPRDRPAGCVVWLPDADQTPEQALGLADGIAPASQAPRLMAEKGFMVVIPVLVNRQPLDPSTLNISDEAQRRLSRQDQTHREWLYRQSYHMGRHIIGYEVQKVLAAVEWLKQRGGPDAKVGVAGHGEGGLIAFYAAAVDPAVDAALVSGYFNSRELTWTEPLYRNVWSLLDRFGDAELSTLIAPRGLVIEHSATPEITGHKGESRTPELESVRKEFERIATFLPSGFQPRRLVHGANGAPIGPGSAEALEAFASMLGVADANFAEAVDGREPLSDGRREFDPAVRQLRQVREIQDHVQGLVRASTGARDRFYGHKAMPQLADSRWSTVVVHETHPPEAFIEASKFYRAYFHEEVQGRFEEELLPPNPRARLIYSNEQWAGYDVVLDVFPDLAAWGVLALPHDLEPGERRPVVVVQHGRNGLPENLIVKDHSAYRRVAAQLAERGFVVFVPHNLYRAEARYRPLNRKANTVKATLYSFLLHQHDQILRWLNTLEFVDGDRIAFYGNSFGGETALRVPPLLEGYALSICASYFNQWARKAAGADDHFSYLFTDEWETPVFNAGHTFDHAELAYLMVPRPFMVERGHHDHVAHDSWVAHEYARVRRLYSMLGLADRTTIEFFQGGHGMRLEGSLSFLHQHLNWPGPNQGGESK